MNMMDVISRTNYKSMLVLYKEKKASTIVPINSCSTNSTNSTNSTSSNLTYNIKDNNKTNQNSTTSFI